MTQEQFYYCLSRIFDLRKNIAQAKTALSVAEGLVPDHPGQGQIDFDTLQRYAKSKEMVNNSVAEAHALIKELVAQEAKIREFVPVMLYGTRIEANLPQQPCLFVVVEDHRITVEKPGEGGGAKA